MNNGENNVMIAGAGRTTWISMKSSFARRGKRCKTVAQGVPAPV
ncbi:hypothetical protein [Kosakonia oryzae]|nr:hypothetical protein [Kosakonia oryzae]